MFGSACDYNFFPSSASLSLSLSGLASALLFLKLETPTQLQLFEWFCFNLGVAQSSYLLERSALALGRQRARLAQLPPRPPHFRPFLRPARLCSARRGSALPIVAVSYCYCLPGVSSGTNLHTKQIQTIWTCSRWRQKRYGTPGHGSQSLAAASASSIQQTTPMERKTTGKRTAKQAPLFLSRPLCWHLAFRKLAIAMFIANAQPTRGQRIAPSQLCVIVGGENFR